LAADGCWLLLEAIEMAARLPSSTGSCRMLERPWGGCLHGSSCAPAMLTFTCITATHNNVIICPYMLRALHHLNSFENKDTHIGCCLETSRTTLPLALSSM
jgi:hypothetical protein